MGARELSQGLVRPPIERFREPPQRLSSQKFRLAAPDIYNYTLLGANIYMAAIQGYIGHQSVKGCFPTGDLIICKIKSGRCIDGECV